ncbi:hypothetical protein Poli38472_001007 [Pythium oligandrum]|uniref:Uncharacterized protein n=1 Tax=Pythium oligandrum TaxID=41045 RepID=A0A8K1CDU7_PYTOL|nr:hypothetical protein Poli38472_001007 [Pythium oligandrum]|eukprot:TMW60965.1 hypothetical protein Poli38472_001007 [Pythium oligandrum]
MTASLADTAAVSGPAPPSTDALGTSVSIYFPMLAFALLLFEVLRRRKSWRILQPENTFGIQQARLQRWYSWIPLLFNVTDKEIVDKCGLDAWVILRFIRLGEKIAGVAVLASFLLFPLYVTSPLPAIQVLEQNASAPSSLLHPVEKRHIDSFDQLSIANVESGSWRLWFAILTAYAVSFGVMYLVRDEYAIYMKYRHDFLAHRDAPQYSVVVTDLPKRLRHPQPLLEYMNYLFPDSVHSVYVGVECRRLEELIEERQAVQYRLDGAIATLKGEAVLPRHNDRKVEPMTTKRPHITVERSCLGVCGRGKEVDAIEYYGGELERINREIEKQSLEIGVRQAYLDTQPQTQKKYGSIQQEKPLHRMLSLMKRLKVSSQKKEERGAKVKKGTSSQSTTVDSQSETSSLLRKELHVEDGDSRERAIEVAQQFLATLTGGSLTVAEIMRNAAFVSFRTLRAAHSAQQLLQTENPVKLRIHPAPHIKDVVWVNFGLPHRIKSTWGLLAAGLTFVIVCFWTIPTAFVTSLANVQKLRRTSPFWDDLIDIHPWVERSLEQLAPVLLSGMNILAGVIFGILATREGHLSLAEVNTSLFTKLCYFQVFQMFFVSAVTGSIITQMMALVDQPKRVLFFLGSSIASQSMLFITFIIVQVSMALPMVLLRVVPIMKDVFHRIFAPSYAQLPERRPWMGLYPLGYVSDIDPAYTLAQQYLIFLLVVVFAPIAPLLSYVGLLFFLCAEVVFRRHYFFVNESKWATVNSTGIFWPTLFNFIIGALFIAQCTLIGLLSLKGVGVLPFVVGATLPFCTLLFYWYVATLLCYPKASQNLPLDRCCDLDIARKNESTDFLKDVYKQPAMAQVEALQAQLEAPVLRK